MPVQQDDVLLLCSDGLHRVLADAELEEALRDADVGGACKRLIETANARGAADNLTAAVIRITGAIAPGAQPTGLLHRVRELVGI